MVQRDPADIEEQHRVEDDISAAALALEVSVLAVICRRLGKLRPDSEVRKVYASMPEDLAEISAVMGDGINNLEQRIKEAMERMARDNDEWAAWYYSAAGVDQVAAADHPQMLEKLSQQTKDAVEKASAMVRTSVISVSGKPRSHDKALLSIEDGYKRIVGAAANRIKSDAVPYKDAIAQAVTSLSMGGLRVEYESGLTRELYSAVSMNTLDAYRTCMSDLREIQGLEFGANGVEVTAHQLCAPDHIPYQGRQFTYEQWRVKQFEPKRPYVIGPNCGHMTYPVIIGISSSAYTPDRLEDMRAFSEGEIKIKGVGHYSRNRDGSLGKWIDGQELTMSRYDASQYQRRIETAIRKAKCESYLQGEAGADTSSMDAAIKRQVSEYKRISAEAGLNTRMDRARAYVQ